MLTLNCLLENLKYITLDLDTISGAYNRFFLYYHHIKPQIL